MDKLAPQIARRWLKVREVAELLHLHRISVYKAVKEGRIPGSRLKGVGLRIDWQALNAALESRAKKREPKKAD